jgi:hypothetical protein
MSRNKFPHDQDNRIQKLYYDVIINTIFNRTKLQNVKNKFWKYLTYLQKYEQNNIQPKLLELQTIRDGLYIQLQRAKKIAFIHNPAHESIEFKRFIESNFSEADDNYKEMKCEQYLYDVIIDDLLQDKIQDIETQQKKIKHYKKCSHCEKMDMVTICGCKSKHKLCSECIYDKTECPVCNEDLGLVHCDICMVYKKELVNTGCENKHQTCKDCLDKIKQKNNKCPFCREKLVAQVEIGISLVMSQTGCTRNVARNVLNDNDGDVALSIMDINGENEDMNRLSIMDINGENDNDGITMHMENMRETYPSRRYTRREREEEEEYTRREREEEEEEDRRDHMEDRIESMRDRRESMRERARENRAR